MKYMLLLLLLVAGCSAQTLDTVQIPAEYSVTYQYANSGFAGMNASSVNVTYSQSNSSYPLMQDIVQRAQGLDFDSELQIDDITCFLADDVPVRSTAVCLKDNEIVVWHDVQYKGNHQAIREMWVQGVEYPFNTDCSKRANPGCSVNSTVQ